MNPAVPEQLTPKKDRVVEIIGVAGAGKSTLYKELGECSRQIRLSDFPDVHKAGDASFFVLNGLKVLTSVMTLPRYGSRQFSRREFAWMSVILGWPNVLEKELRNQSGMILLDQGPVYLMGEMKEFGPDYLRTKAANRLWHRLYERWASILDTIIWLDAADFELLKRIRNREQEHVVKKSTEMEMMEFLNTYRRIYETTVAALQARNSALQVIRIDTGKLGPLEIRDEILKKMGVS